MVATWKKSHAIRPRACELTVDAAVDPVGVLLCQPQDKGGGARRNARPTGPTPRVGPALGDELAVRAQQSCRLDEELPETLAGEQSCERGQHRSVCVIECWSTHLASQDRHLVAQHDDFDGEARVSAREVADQL